MTLFMLIFVGVVVLLITTVVDSAYMHHNQTWMIFKNQAWPILRICLLSVSLISFTSALFMLF